MKRLVVASIVLIAISLFLLSLSTVGIQVSARGRNQDTAICLWQISGAKPVNHLITSTDECARLFERYSDGNCVDETGTLVVSTSSGDAINFQYETYCRKIIGAKSFTVMAGAIN